MPEAERLDVRTVLIGVLTAILVLAALREAAAVAMPLTFALFLVLLAAPLQRRLQARLPRPAAYGLTLGALLAIAAIGVWVLAESVDEVVERLPVYAPRLEGMLAQLQQTLAARGMPALPIGDGPQAPAVEQAIRRLVGAAVDAFGFVVLVTALCVLALREVDEFRLKFKERLRNRWDAPLIDSAGKIVEQLQRYVVTRVFTSSLTGVLTGIFAWVIGLELALAWAVLTTLLNFIPTLGTLAAVGGITLFALMQFQSVGMTLVVLGGLGTMQIVIGSYVDPRLQGKRLSLSPFAVLVAVVFWGWMWGPLGALLGVPLTAALMIAFREFAGTRWMADLLDNVPPERERPSPKRRPLPGPPRPPV